MSYDPRWWWSFHWDCMTCGSPLMKQEYDAEADSIGSYHAAIKAIGDGVKAGEPLPTTGYFRTHHTEAR